MCIISEILVSKLKMSNQECIIEIPRCLKSILIYPEYTHSALIIKKTHCEHTLTIVDLESFNVKKARTLGA